ncbi:MAG: tetratricopeptide repeat protein [Candidatus Thorarchaeota archaeon]
MVDSKPKEINKAEKLISEGKTEEALEIVREFQQNAWSHFIRQESDKALDIALQSKKLIEKIGEEVDFARNYLLLGWVYSQKGDFQISLDFGMKSLDLNRKLENKIDLASVLYLIGSNHYANENFDLALEICRQSLSIKEINLLDKVGNLHILGHISLLKGDLSQALRYFKNGLKLTEKGKIHSFLVRFMYYLGHTYSLLNDFDKTEEYLKKTIFISEELGFHFYKARALGMLVVMNLISGLHELAQECLDRLKNFTEKQENEILTKFYLFTSGFVLSKSNNEQDRAEAEILLKQVIEDEQSSIGMKLYGLYYLCELHIENLERTNDLKIIDKIYLVISLLFNVAERLQSHMLLSEVKIFQAKVELIQMNFDEAKILLNQAQKIAELHKIQILTQIASNEHDRLLKQQDEWERLNNAKAPLKERIKLASFDGILNRIQGRRSEKLPEVDTETPVFLLIITESGIPLFSHSFSRELSFEDDIISSFISAFNTFSGELFSKGLDRARFGDYIILIESVESYSVCYLFKGQTYPAKQKLTNFIEGMQNNSMIWQTLDKFYRMSQVAELKDVPLLESLMSEIFLSKTYEK